MAKASGEGRASPLVRPPSCGKDPYEPWEMNPREREISNKYLKLITYHSQRYENYYITYFMWSHFGAIFRELVANQDQLNIGNNKSGGSSQQTPSLGVINPNE